MATETTIKFRRGNGTPTVNTAFDQGSIGEPLWSTDKKLLYVTDGTATPVLIGPGQVIAVEQTLASGTEIATITIDGTPTKIYAPTSGSGETAVTQTLDVVNSNETNPTLITLTDTNSIELESSPANTNVTTVIAGESAGASENGKAKLLFDVQINVIDGGTWPA